MSEVRRKSWHFVGAQQYPGDGVPDDDNCKNAVVKNLQDHADASHHICDAAAVSIAAVQGKELRKASREGDLDVVKRLLAASGVNVNAWDEWYRTPLHLACVNGHVAVVQQLLAAGAHANAMDWVGDSPLHWASIEGHVAVVQQLVAAGADVSATSLVDVTAVPYTSEEGHEDVVQQLLTSSAGIKNKWHRTALLCATWKGHVAVVPELLLATNMLAEDKSTALNKALCWGRSEVAGLLLESTGGGGASNIHDDKTTQQ